MIRHCVVGACCAGAIGLGQAAFGQLQVLRDPVPGTGSWTTISNGDFESGTMTGWTDTSATRGVFRATDEHAFAGSFSARTMTATPGSGAGYAAMTTISILVTPGETYVLSAFLRTVDFGARLYVDLGDTIADPSVQACNDIDGWQFAWQPWTAEVPVVHIRLVCDLDRAPGDAGFIDEVGFTPIAEFVPPDSAYTCYADCDPGVCPGSLDVFDFLCFQNAFAGGDPYADCDGSGGFDIFDFLCYQNAFAAACP